MASISNDFKYNGLLKTTFKLCGKPISLEVYHMCNGNDWLHYSSKMAILSPVQPILVTVIKRNKYYLGPVIEVLWNKRSVNSRVNFITFYQANIQPTRFLIIAVSSWNTYFTKSLWKDLDIFVYIDASSWNWLDWAENCCFWWIVKLVIPVAHVVNFERDRLPTWFKSGFQ